MSAFIWDPSDTPTTEENPMKINLTPDEIKTINAALGYYRVLSERFSKPMPGADWDEVDRLLKRFVYADPATPIDQEIDGHDPAAAERSQCFCETCTDRAAWASQDS